MLYLTSITQICEASDSYLSEALWEHFESTISPHIQLYQVGKVRKGTATLGALLDKACAMLQNPQQVRLLCINDCMDVA